MCVTSLTVQGPTGGSYTTVATLPVRSNSPIPHALVKASISHSLSSPYDGFTPSLIQWCKEKEGEPEHDYRIIAANRITEAARNRSKALNLSCLGLTSLPVDLGKLTLLETLHLNQNQITDITVLKKLILLRVLFLHNNQISQIAPLSGLRNLSTLHLHNNLISDLCPLEGLAELRRLFLGKNNIVEVSPLAALRELQILSLVENKIKTIAFLRGLNLLEDLDISRTSIEEVPLAFAQLPKGSVVTASETLLSLAAIQTFEAEIKKVSEETPHLGPRFISCTADDGLIPPYNMIQTHFPGREPPVIARSSHETSNYLGSKISVLLGKLGAVPKDVDVNFYNLDPTDLIKEVHRGMKLIREKPRTYCSIPIELLSAAEKNRNLFPTIHKIRQAAESAMAKCDGLVLSGGPDIEGEFYQDASELAAADYRRSIAEFALADAAFRQHKPILGTCRGAQLANVLFGGTLRNVNRQMDWQTIEVADSSKSATLEKLFEGRSIPAYFFHHQACSQIAPGFEVVMQRGEIPEMILSPDDMVIGIQVHPELDEKERYSKAIRVYRLFLEKVIGTV